MAAELDRYGIRVNALSLKRMAHPDERVGPALLLTSDAGSFITGHVVFADGGMIPRRASVGWRTPTASR